MKHLTSSRPIGVTTLVWIGLAALSTLHSQFSSLLAQGTAFTYQGQLARNSLPYNGPADMQFALFSVASGGAAIATNTPPIASIEVTNGLFIVALDFGAAAFSGEERWLEIQVRTGLDPSVTLSPRQQITPTPYALRAREVTGVVPGGGLAGAYDAAVTFSNAGNTFTGNGAGLVNVNAATLGGLSSSNFWSTTGNSGTSADTHFLGTTDPQPLELKVNGLRALRLEDNGDSLANPSMMPNGAPNVIGGSPVNFVGVGVVGAILAGGGATNYEGTPFTNSVFSDFGVVGGGLGNTIAANSFAATIAGGFHNDISINSDHSAIGGGFDNHIVANSFNTTIAGGVRNNIGTNSPSSAIGGGNHNTVAANSSGSAIAGGMINDIGPNCAISAIGGGQDNNIAANSFGATIAGGNGNNITNSNYGAIGGGQDNTVGASFYATIAGGSGNDIGRNSNHGAIGGGLINAIAADASVATIAGGQANNIGINADYSQIGGGRDNNIGDNASYASIPGGRNNEIGTGAFGAFAAGQRAKANHTGAFVWADSQNADFASTAVNQFNIRAAGGVGIGTSNPQYPLDVAGAVRITRFGDGTEILNLSTERSWAFRQLGAGAGTALELVSIGGGGGKSFVINTTGFVGIGTTTPGFNLHVNGTAGKPGGGSWAVASDKRLKKNIRPLGGALDKLLALHGVSFEYIDPAKIHELSGERMGLVAQEVEKVFPDWVETGADGYKRVTVRGLEALVVEALRELRQEQEASETKLAAELKRRDVENAELKTRLERLEQRLNDPARNEP